MSENKLEELRSRSESLVNRYVNLLSVSPSARNVQYVLTRFQTWLILGGATNTPTYDVVLRGVANASEKLEG